MLPREPGDRWEPYEIDRFTARIDRRAARPARRRHRSSPARVNGEPGLWVGFSIDERPLLAAGRPDARRADVDQHLVRLGRRSRCSPPCSARRRSRGLINRPLKELSFAASRIRDGEYDSRLDETTMTSEIREVNMGFNRMARELAKVEQDRAVMLAGISHDLRTPLARLRLEAEMSVPDEEAQGQHGDGHRPARRDHRQVHGLRAAGRRRARAGARCATSSSARRRRSATRARSASRSQRRRSTRACWPTTSSSAACLQTCSRTRAATAARPRPASPRCIVEPRAHRAVGDHQGARPRPGRARPKKLDQLTTPFFRGDAARTAATGAGLGLAIVEKTMQRMGGTFELDQHAGRGLVAHIRLQRRGRCRPVRGTTPKRRADAACERCEPSARQRCSSTTARASIASPSPDRPQLLGRLRLDVDLIDVDAERAGDALAHRRDVRRQLRRLRDHGRVDVADLPARGPHAARRLGEQRERIGARYCASVSGKWWPMSPSAAAPNSASVIAWQQRVGIGMAEQAVRVRRSRRRRGSACGRSTSACVSQPSPMRQSGPRGFMRAPAPASNALRPARSRPG